MQRFLLVLLACGLWSCTPESESAPATIQSPDGRLELQTGLDKNGQIYYTLNREGAVLIDTSRLGFDLQDQPQLATNLRITATATRSFSETWAPLWGEDARVDNTYEELTVDLEERTAPGRNFQLIFRLFDDGLGFRYHFPAQGAIGEEMVIMDEHTEFQLTGDHLTWWQPGDWDIYEHLYNTTRFSEIDAIAKRNNPNLAQTYIPENAVNTPVTMRTDAGIHLSFHEANLTDYAGMTLRVNKENLRWESELVGAPDGSKATVSLPFSTPWRTIQVAEQAGDLIESKLILNLNEPSVLEDTDWIKPMKYVGIWWEMHLGKSSWDMASGRHGATTENAKRYIDFAAANKIQGVLVEGWNTGWERWIGFEDREGVFDFVTPYPDYDIEEVARYAESKGVQLIMHHETSAAPRTYEQQLDTAFQLCQRLVIHAVKTGYVGPIIPKGERHHGQWMVRHYRKVLETAARYQVAVNAHEPIKATGLRRTYPNMLAREGLRGQEFNAWGAEGGNPPEHTVIVPFTRMLGGPIDFTPGIFDIKFDQWKPDNQVSTTLAKQLALYVTLYSPLQMAADLPENYEGQPAFEFIRQVPVDWDESRVLNGEVGDYLTIVRKEKGGERWFMGSITDEESRAFDLELDFLEAGKAYRAFMYVDATDAHWDDNPLAINIQDMLVEGGQTLPLRLAPGGGAAMYFEPVEN